MNWIPFNQIFLKGYKSLSFFSNWELSHPPQIPIFKVLDIILATVHNETKVILTSYYSDSKIWNVISLLSCVILYNSVKYEIVGFFSKCKYKKNFNWLCLHVWFLSCLHSPNTHVYVPFWLKWKDQQFWVIHVRDRSLATLTKCWLLLTTYLPGWHWWRNSFTVIRENLHIQLISYLVPPT